MSSGTSPNFGAPGGQGPGSGGIVNLGRLTLVRSVVSENRGYKGGGIGSTGKVVLVTSRVTDNIGLGPGGGIANFGGRVVLRELSRVEGNTSESALPGPGGGGVFNRGRLDHPRLIHHREHLHDRPRRGHPQRRRWHGGPARHRFRDRQHARRLRRHAGLLRKVRDEASHAFRSQRRGPARADYLLIS